jgi:hypothetical protein
VAREYVNLGSARAQHAEQTELERQATNFLLGGLPILYERLKELGQATRDTAAAEADLAATQDRLSEAFEHEVLSLLETGKTVAQLREEFEALLRTQSEEIAASDSFIAAMERLGITFEGNVNAQIAENISLLATARDLYREGAITADDLARAEAGVAIENAKLQASLEGTNAALTESVAGWDSAAAGLERYRQTAGYAVGTFETLSRAIATTTGAAGALVRSSEQGPGTGGGAMIARGLTNYGGGVVRDALGQRVRIGSETGFGSLAAYMNQAYRFMEVNPRYAQAWAMELFRKGYFN